MKQRHLLRLVGRTAQEWSAGRGWIFAGAMATFAALAMAPLLIVALRIAALFGDRHGLFTTLNLELGMFVGKTSAQTVDTVVRADYRSQRGTVPSIVAVAIGLLAGSRLFYALRQAFDVIWGVERQPATDGWTTVRRFLVAGLVALVVVAAFMALVLLAGEVGTYVHGVALLRLAETLAAAVVLTPLFAGLFRWLPPQHVAWSDVWVGAGATALAFAFGQLGIALYLASADAAVTYGPAAALIVVLLWLYYSATIVLLGAQFTHVYARAYGSRAGETSKNVPR